MVFRNVVVHGVETFQISCIIQQFMQYHAAVQGCEALSHLHIPHVVQRIFSLKVAESFLAFFKIGVRTSIHGDFLVAFRNLQTEIAGTGVDAQESVLFPLRYFNEVVASSQRPYGAAVPVFVRSQHVHADAGDFFIQFRVVQQGLMNGGTGMHPGRDALAQACVKAGKSGSPNSLAVSTPQPISTPIRLGITLSVFNSAVNPMTQPAPACTSGMMRTRLPSKAGWLQTSLIWVRARSSSSSVNTRASVYFPSMVIMVLFFWLRGAEICGKRLRAL